MILFVEDNKIIRNILWFIKNVVQQSNSFTLAVRYYYQQVVINKVQF